MKDKVLFINPPQSCAASAKHSNLKFPLGFLYMAGVLEKHRFKVKILDCPLYYKKKIKINENTARLGLFPEEIKKSIINFQPDIIGVSCAYSAYEPDSFEVIKIARDAEKELGKKILVVVGGAHTSANPEYVLRNNEIDIAVIGEGEMTMLEIAERNRHGKNLKNIPGTAVKARKIIINKPRKYVTRLDELSPAWHLVDMNLYFKHPDNSKVTLRAPSVDIITSRGCPGNCVFCSIHTVWGRGWRACSVKKVVDDIEFLVNKYQVRQFRMQDDNLTLDRKRIIGICNEIIKRKLDIRWDTPNGVAIWTLDEQVLRKMKQAGCYRITFGIESGCNKTQKYIRKIIDAKKISHLIDTCHKIGMWVCSTFILGFPYETPKELEEAKTFILNSKINFPFIYIAQPYPGTDMYNDFKKENLLKDVRTMSHIGESKYSTVCFSNEQLNKIRSDVYKKFYFRKFVSYINPFIFYREFLSKLRGYEDLRYIAKNFSSVLGGV